MWIVRIIDLSSDLKIYEKRFIFRFMAKWNFKKFARLLQLSQGIVGAVSTTYNFLSLNFDYTRLTIVECSVDESDLYPNDKSKDVVELEFDDLDNNWKEFR